MSDTKPDSNQNQAQGKKISPALVIVAIVATMLGTWFSMRVFVPANAHISAVPAIVSGTWLSPTRSLPKFNLVDHDNKPFTLARLKHKWTFLFFGYTHCPDVCPNTLTTLKVMSAELEKTNAKDMSHTQFVFVSVDPKRDSPEKLKSFTQYFNKRFIGVTGPHAELEKLTNSLGILFSVEKNPKNGNYLVDHSAHIILVNPQGHFQAVFPYPQKVRNLISDYKSIMNTKRKSL